MIRLKPPLHAMLCAMLLAPAGTLGAQTFDSSANSALSGNYFVRQLSIAADASGVLQRAFTFYGTMNFDGNGKYTFNGQTLDSNVGQPKQASITGTYAVGANGLAQVQSLLEDAQFIHGAVAQSVFLGSSTESTVLNDILIAIPAGANASNSSLRGAYTVGALEFLQSDGTPRDSYFTLTPDGQGGFPAIAVNGSAADMSDTNTTQTISGATYSISGGGSGSATFPAAVAGTAQKQLFTGGKVLYVSADGNTILGGGANTFDIFVGVRAASGTASNGTYQGTYFVSGLEDRMPSVANGTDNIQSFSGSIKAIGNGANLTHLRINSVLSGIYDYTYDMGYSVAPDGTITDNFFHYALGANGQSLVIVGRGNEYELGFALRAPAYSGGGVYLNPVGIVNAASMAPITNSVAPGELVTLYGTGLASAKLVAPGVPFPSTLGGVQVLVNNRPAPVYYVSPTQLSVLVPYATAEIYATFQVINNGVASNAVTVYTNTTAPGVFSINQTGYGPGSILHANNTLVTSQNPARAGETVQIFLTGLGAVNPVVADGAAAPSSPLSLVTAPLRVQVDGKDATVSFQGLAPGFAGLYQVNAVIPAGVTSGTVYLDISTNDALQSEVTIAAAP